MHFIRSITPATIFAFIFSMLMEGLLYVWSVPQYIMPRPSVVAQTIIDNFTLLMDSTMITFGEALIGFILANALAFVTAVTLSLFLPIYRISYPLLVGLQAVPLVAVAPYIVLWLGTGFTSKIAMATLICFFPATIICTNALRSTADRFIDYLHSIRGERLKHFIYVICPSSLPAFMSALQVTAPLSIIGALVAEFSGANRGLGFVIINSSYTYNTPLMLSCVLVASIMTMLLTGLLSLLNQKVRSVFGLKVF